ncbi:MAG: VOC family protein [Sediminibacterium sp. Gen4]|jgi:catechol-2,3-dioxygenase|uniref:VOC family protein n=1 Tax=unclassified Sediminibacterium TaxID=2635961 RepID=UPI0015B92F4D|nr:MULTISPECIES: VOC family protein [unclassified Sediminibacterium]MBW0160370.1 VOC family protein [Sediminibacterium sp.]MBW0163661.1 VOC family protein [Sediminibacterium sp.]NWK67105.1 VOC family protein [Sediminibacterium sp. Gen4]
MNENNLLQGIDTIIVRVTNIEKSSSWYQEKLGLTPVWEDNNLNLVVLDTKSPTSLTLWETDQPITVNKKTTTYPIFKTINAADARDQLLKNDVKVGELSCDESICSFLFFDLDGNILEACQVIQ